MSSLRLRPRCTTRPSFVAAVFCASLFAACRVETAPPAELDGGAVDSGTVVDARVDARVDLGAPDLSGCVDDDGDGHRASACGGDDCDDANPTRYPTATEMCDRDDEDCNDATFGADSDGDGFESSGCCNGPDNCGTDCNDLLNTVNPGASEVCNGGIDDDCDGLADAADGVCVPCAPGFTGLDTLCVDNDECAMGQCGAAAGTTCNNTRGSYECMCPAGYAAPESGGTCADVDECAGDICGVGESSCANLGGTYACTCLAGFAAATTTGAPCLDIDECARGDCGPGTVSCTNTVGSYACTCAPGYSASAATGAPCVQINECALGTDECTDPPAGVCTDTDGSFTCACAPGFPFGTRSARGPSGCLGRFTDLGDGTVRDNNRSGLEWQQGFSPATQSQAESLTYCSTLTLDGGGWRMPTIDELRTLVDGSRSNPSIDTSFFPATPATFFWSGTPVAGTPTNGWGVFFTSGIAHNFIATAEFRARCVR